MSALRHLLIRARRQIFSEMVGNNPSMFHGEGYDFSELREYQVGDDIKHIDWNITAKMQTPYVKVFKEERELSVVLVSMMGGSLHFGSTKLKHETLSEIIALLSFSAIKNGDLLSHLLIQEAISHATKPSKRIKAVHECVTQVVQTSVLNRSADYAGLGALLMRRIKRKSLVVIVGDFFALPDLRVLAKKHEVVALVVRDTIEEHPPSMGFSALVDPQSGAVLEGDFGKSAVKSYAKKIQAHDHALFEHFKKAQVRFTKIYTHDHAYAALRRFFGAL